MKKVIALTLVMAATTFAAQFTTSFVGPDQIVIGQPAHFDVTVTGSGDLFVAEMSMWFKAVAGFAGPDVATISNVTTTFEEGNPVGDMPALPSAATGNFISLYPQNAPLPMVLFSFDLTGTLIGGKLQLDVAAPGTAAPGAIAGQNTMFQSEGGDYSAAEQIFVPKIVEVIDVPEPATLALLAIGGLAIIRRR